VDQSDLDKTALGRGITEGKATPFSKGLTRGASPVKLVSGAATGDPKGFAGGAAPEKSSPQRAAPTAFSGAAFSGSASSGSVVSGSAFAGSNVLALKPASDEAIAYKRDYEERAKELAEEIADENPPDLFESDAPSPTTALFSDKAAADAAAAKTASAKTEAKALAAARRQQSLMQGYTGNECSECHNFTMVRNGTCEKCDTCGSTSGCS
jgi:ribonucleoside-diphosphate reductase alpha chain